MFFFILWWFYLGFTLVYHPHRQWKTPDTAKLNIINVEKRLLRLKNSCCPLKYSLLRLGTKCSPKGQIFHGLQIAHIIVDCHGQGGSDHLVRCRSAPCLRSAWCCWASCSSSAPTWDQQHHRRRHQAQKPLKRTKNHHLKAQNRKKEKQSKTWITNL